MNLTIWSNILTPLNADATILSYLGGARVFRGWINQDTVIPCITVTENNETTTQRVGYLVNAHHRLNTVYVQFDVWVSKDTQGFPCTKDDLDTIAQYLDYFILHTGFTNTGLWEKVSTSEQFESDTALFHKALRYKFNYKLTD